MSSHSNLTGCKKCWGCAFYNAKREFKSGIFLGDSIMCDSKGICSNPKSTNNNKTVFESNSCSKYTIWAVLENELAKKAREEAKREEKKNAKLAEEMEMEKARQERLERYREEEIEREQREQQTELKRQRRAIEEERQKLAAERKKLEYDRWYMTLSDEEKKAEDERKTKEEEERKIKQQQEQEEARVRAQQQAEERKREEELAEQRRIEEEKERAAQAKKKRLIIILSSIIGSILMLVFVVVLAVVNSNVKDSNQPYKKIDEYLSQYSNNTYTETSKSGGVTITSTFKCSEDGFYTVELTIPLSSSNIKADKITTHLWLHYGKVESGSTEIYGSLYTGANYTDVLFSNFTFNSCPSVNSNYKYVITANKYGTPTSEEIDTLWAACVRTFRFANSVVKKVDSSYSLW